MQEIAITLPDRKVVTKAENVAKQNASTRLEVSTNVTKKTEVGKKGSGAESVSDYFDDLDGVNQDKEVALYVESSRGMIRTTRASSHVSHGTIEDDADENRNGSNDNGDHYYEAQVCNSAGDVIKRELLPPGAMLTINGKSDDLRQQSKFIVHANEEVARLTSQLGVLESKYHAVDKRISSQDKKHRKYKAERDDIAATKEKVEKELIEAKSQLELQETKLNDLKYQLSQQEFDLHLHSDIITSHERQVERTNSGIASFFQSDIKPLFSEDCIWLARIRNSRRYLKRLMVSFPMLKRNLTMSWLLSLLAYSPSLTRTSSAMASLGATTHGRHSTPSFENFSHTRTPEQLKKKNSTRIGNPLAV
ncbi:hypothetical protein Tco_1484524 [Tanacetum coccineum]